MRGYPPASSTGICSGRHPTRLAPLDIQSINLVQPSFPTDQRHAQVAHRKRRSPAGSFPNGKSALCGSLIGPAPTRYSQSGQGVLVGIGRSAMASKLNHICPELSARYLTHDKREPACSSTNRDQPSCPTAQRHWQVLHRNTSPLPRESFANGTSAACGFIAGAAPTRWVQSSHGVLAGMGSQRYGRD